MTLKHLLICRCMVDPSCQDKISSFGHVSNYVTASAVPLPLSVFSN